MAAEFKNSGSFFLPDISHVHLIFYLSYTITVIYLAMSYYDPFTGYGNAAGPTGQTVTACVPSLPEGGYGGAPWSSDPFVPFVCNRWSCIQAHRMNIPLDILPSCILAPHSQHNIQPASRQQKHTAKDKDALEKSRLAAVCVNEQHVPALQSHPRCSLHRRDNLPPPFHSALKAIIATWSLAP